MDHPCQKCGTTVEDGRPFCPQCRAPQIHVQFAVPDAVIPSGLNPTADELSPEILQAEHSGGRRLTAEGAMPGRSLHRGIAVRSALKAGVLGVFIGIIPFLGIVLTGSLAVYFYRRESSFTLPAALGSRVGGAAGVVAFAINALLMTVRIFVFHAQQEYTDFFLRIAQRFGTDAADPEIRAAVHSLFTPAGLAFALFFWMIFAVVLASAGGALASLLMRPRNPRM